MKTIPLFTLVFALATAIGCDRTEATRETREAARDAAAGVREVAGRAGDRLADTWVTAKVQAQFFADDDIKSRYIDVDTRDGVVRLTGFVEDDAVRREAVAIAMNTDGVRDVQDELLIGQVPPDRAASEPVASSPEPVPVAPEPGSAPTAGAAPVPPVDDTRLVDDETAKTLIQAKFFRNPTIKSRRIEVQIADGIVTLRGEVASEDERAQALLLARTTEGVERVEDSLTVNPALPPPGAHESARAIGTAGVHPEDVALAEAVRQEVTADAQLAAAGIEVTARDGVVLLQGTVPTQAAKQRALTAARRMEGVVQVVDRITVR